MTRSNISDDEQHYGDDHGQRGFRSGDQSPSVEEHVEIRVAELVGAIAARDSYEPDTAGLVTSLMVPPKVLGEGHAITRRRTSIPSPTCSEEQHSNSLSSVFGVKVLRCVVNCSIAHTSGACPGRYPAGGCCHPSKRPRVP